MKKFIFMAILATSVSAFAGNGQCILCEINRANNEKSPNQYPYYEDYLQAVKDGKVTPANPSATTAAANAAAAAAAEKDAKI